MIFKDTTQFNRYAAIKGLIEARGADSAILGQRVLVTAIPDTCYGPDATLAFKMVLTEDGHVVVTQIAAKYPFTFTSKVFLASKERVLVDDLVWDVIERITKSLELDREPYSKSTKSKRYEEADSFWVKLAETASSLSFRGLRLLKMDTDGYDSWTIFDKGELVKDHTGSSRYPSLMLCIQACKDYLEERGSKEL